jgi:putative acetyltransferase
MQVEGLTIRRAEPDDCGALYEIFTSPKLYANTLQLPYPSREVWRQRIAEPGDGAHNLAAIIGDKVVGMFGLQTFPHRPRRQHVGTIGMSVHEDWHGKGVGTALMHAGIDLADNWLNLTRLELEVYTDNEPAIRLYERFGFEREGLLRRHAYRDGRYVDSYVMARLRAPA